MFPNAIGSIPLNVSNHSEGISSSSMVTVGNLKKALTFDYDSKKRAVFWIERTENVTVWEFYTLLYQQSLALLSTDTRTISLINMMRLKTSKI